MKVNDFVILTANGANNPDNGIRYGKKGQAAKVVGDGTYDDLVIIELLARLSGQHVGSFYCEKDRLKLM